MTAKGLPEAVDVAAIVRSSGDGLSPPEVVYRVHQESRLDYLAAAEILNASGTDVVCVQHEFGIFGGPEGLHIVELLRRLRMPVVTTFHTVLPEPPAHYHRALRAVADHSDHVVAMTETARRLLCQQYDIAPEQISVIPHGVPDLPFEETDAYKARLGVAGRTVLMTFGLIGPGKGIEFVLEALPRVVQAHPAVLYVILGATHPEVKRQEGERYRQELQQLVRNQGLENHVLFVDRYVEGNELRTYLQACDVYVTPYPGQDQICSGTLAYAVGAGKAVVATPYLHAQELLAEGRGRLVPHGDVEGLCQALEVLAGDEAERNRLRRRAYARGREMTWDRVAARYVEVFEGLDGKRQHRAFPGNLRPVSVRVSLDHLAALTDDTGILQHASYGIPDRHHGYCTDDAGRALVVALWHYGQHRNGRALALARVYLSFLHYAQRPDGGFHNFMDYQRRFTDERGSEDTVGRALWGLGAAVAWAPWQGVRILAQQMFERAMKPALSHPRALAYAICGADLYLARYPGAERVRRRVQAMGEQLAARYRQARGEAWHWFDDRLTYANAKLPQAMMLAYKATGDEAFKSIGLKTLSFLTDLTYRDGCFDFVGNRGWYPRDGECARFGQQPIEAGYMAEACTTAYDVTEEDAYLQWAWAAAEWFTGRNRLGAQLYDPETGACADGLEPQGPSLNQGAESVIAAQLGFLSLEAVGAKQAPSTLSRLTRKAVRYVVNAGSKVGA